MAKNKKKKKGPGGLMGELLKAGVVSQKEARSIRKEQREEIKQIKKEKGFAGIHEAKEQKLEDQRKLVEQKRQEELKQQEQLAVVQKRRRIETLMRDRVTAAGNRRFYFVRPDKVIDFVESDDNTIRQLGGREAAIVHKLQRRAGDYLILPVNSKFKELKELQPDQVLFPR